MFDRKIAPSVCCATGDVDAVASGASQGIHSGGTEDLLQAKGQQGRLQLVPVPSRSHQAHAAAERPHGVASSWHAIAGVTTEVVSSLAAKSASDCSSVHAPSSPAAGARHVRVDAAAPLPTLQLPPFQLHAPLLEWLHRHLGILPEHIISRHDNPLFVLVALLHPVYFTTPFLITIWGHYSGWKPLFWVPCVLFGVSVQGMCAGGFWYPPETYLWSRVGLFFTLLSVAIYSVVIAGPLFMQPLCGTCIPLGDLMAYTFAIFVFTIVQVLMCSLLYRSKVHPDFANTRTWWIILRCARVLDGYSDLGLTSGMWLILGKTEGYSTEDLVMLTAMMIASAIDLTIAMTGVFVHLGEGKRGILLHVTTLLCEITILIITIIVLRVELNTDDRQFNSATAYMILSGLSTIVGFVLSAYGIRNVLRLTARVVQSTSAAVTQGIRRASATGIPDAPPGDPCAHLGGNYQWVSSRLSAVRTGKSSGGSVQSQPPASVFCSMGDAPKRPHSRGGGSDAMFGSASSLTALRTRKLSAGGAAPRLSHSLTCSSMNAPAERPEGAVSDAAFGTAGSPVSVTWQPLV